MEGMFGSVGFEVRNSERLVRWLRMKPEGMWCFEAVWRISLKRTSPAEQELGGGSFKNLASVSAVKCGFTDIGVFTVWIGWGFREPICQCDDDWQMVGAEGSQWLPGGTH